METIMQRLRDARNLVAKAGPYVLIEVLLPGGTLLALLLFLYQRSQGGAADSGPQLTVAIAWAIGKVRHAFGIPPSYVVRDPMLRERDGLEPLAMSPQH